MGLLGRAEPGAGHERFEAADRVRFLARAGRMLDAVRPEKSIVRLAAELFVPKFAVDAGKRRHTPCMKCLLKRMHPPSGIA